MNEEIKLILSLSVSASILALILFAVKPIIKHKLSKSVQYYIWIVVLLRLVVPFSFQDSIMNNLFYSNENATARTYENNEIDAQPVDSIDEGLFNSSSLINQSVEKNVANGLYNNDIDHSRYYKDLFNKYVLYLWLLGAIIVLAVNVFGYIRFLKYLRKGYKPAKDIEKRLLSTLLNGRNNVRLLHNAFITTPMLIGILRPCIIIPDGDFDNVQLKNILLHEITHLRHYDVGIKWLTMIATSIHWFNPLMYFIRKEINNSCELACDEKVIKNFNKEEKQFYGDTLISFAEEQKYSTGVLQVTMCEEKKSLKERLLSIMKHNRKSKLIIAFSAILLGAIIFGALYLGGAVEGGKDTPPNISNSAVDNLTYNLAEISRYKTPYIGDNSKISAIASQLPVPHSYFKQRYISMETSNEPYSLIIYYELVSNREYEGDWPITTPDSIIEANSRTNALVVFCMIDNLEEVTFAFRNSQSNGALDESKYNTTFTFPRVVFEEKYGDLSVLGGNLNLLQKILAKKTPVKEIQADGQLSQEVIDFVENNLKIVMESPKESSNPMDYINNHKNEYENIIKYSYKYENEEVLKYMLSQFKEGNAEGLRGQLLMILCKELLGQRNNVTDESLTPMKWFEQLNLREEIILPCNNLYFPLSTKYASGTDETSPCLYASGTDETSPCLYA